MFTLRDIDNRIYALNMAAEDLENTADKCFDREPVRSLALRCEANGLRQAVGSLERMILHAIEDEAREAMREAS